MITQPSDKTIVLDLLRCATPERDGEICRLWTRYGQDIEVAESGSGLTMNATDKRIRFDTKTIDFCWLVGFAFWKSLEVYGPALELATGTGTTLEKALVIDEQRALYEADFKQRISIGQLLIAAQRTADISWPEDLPEPTTYFDSLQDVQDQATLDLVGMALAFTFFHELRHVMFRFENRDAPLPRDEEEMACDTWARAFMTEKAAEYARIHGREYVEVAQMRAMGIALAGAIIHAMTAPHNRWGSADYPPLSERLKAMIDGHTLAETSWFWTFAACILIALLRQQHVKLEITASTAKELVDELFNVLG
ncbi:phage exclusion protein Lit family protein [Methylobacterium ajmalii]|jgi:hypothetical protein|uniref:Phage exclusion protein Lit family protein n=1 Tax=Methylobacterium ajmalii TaxID=2738439 RepID=A0ABV0A4K4_9HYPH|nr:phage exclusion protein Lit family protein [uncultured Methylobacterium sp.]